MKFINVIFVVIFLCGCNNKISFINESSSNFGSQELEAISVNDKKSNGFKVDGSLSSFLKTKFNFYDLFYYSKIKDSLYVLYNYYDYNKSFTLVNIKKIGSDTKSSSYCDIAYISGDAGDFDYKKSHYDNDIFFSEFISGERYFSSPIDTLHIRLKGTSKISVSVSGEIIEDTINVERNFIRLVPHDYTLEDSF